MKGARALILGAAVLLIPLLVLFVVAVLAVAVRQSSAEAGPCSTTNTTSGQPAASTTAKSTIPANYLGLYRQAGEKYGVPWTVLASIGKQESDHGRGNGVGIASGQNYAGAKGPMQFLQATWDAFGVDGDNDGTKDVYNPADAIYGAANYLKHNHADQGGQQLKKAIFAYNHADWYVKNVLRDADLYAAGGYTVTGANTAGTNCVPGDGLDAADVNGPFGQRVVAYAKKWATTKPPTPYVWGGGNEHGPTKTCGHGFCGTGFDCSGLTKYAIYQASGGKINIPHYTFDQIDDPRGQPVKWNELQPGDLIFLSGGDHVVIYAGNDTIVEAPQTGDNVKIGPIRNRGFIGARRFGKGIP